MGKTIFTAILVVFPFGQLIKFGQINLFDVLVTLLSFWVLFQKPKYPNWYKYFISFILFCAFSLLINYQLTELKSILYLVRLVSYSFVAVYISNFFKKRNSLFIILTSVAVFTAIFGWLQYLFIPDVRFLKNFGWDDHLYRMVGTFFDPTYLALILLLGIVIIIYKNKKFFTTKSQALLVFLLITLAFTYSRATYLALGLFLLYKKKFLAITIFAITVLLLPKMLSEGTDFSRTVSGNNKLTNYMETLTIFKMSPAIGVGFNNICPARVKYLNDKNVNSHSCFGSDSSILFILATTGVIGFILFMYYVLSIMYYAPHNSYSIILYSSFGVVLIHSLFVNSLFYPHIMFWLFALLGLEGKINRE